MNFMEAVKAMKEGKKVRRSCWGNKKAHNLLGSYAYIGHKSNDDGSTRESAIFKAEDVQSTDWEIYKESYEEHIKHCDFCESTNPKEEEKFWNLAGTDTFSHVMGREDYKDILESVKKVDDIKTFIQKVKEDCKNTRKETITDTKIDDIIDKRAGDLE